MTLRSGPNCLLVESRASAPGRTGETPVAPFITTKGLSRKLSFSLQYFGQDGLRVRIEVTFPVALQVGIADFGLGLRCLLAGTED